MWQDATTNNNTAMIDPQLTDPENGDYSLADNSPASGYGCQTFNNKQKRRNFPNSSSLLTPDDRTTLSGEIAESLHLTALEIHVTGNVFIPNEVILEFSPGAVISFNGFYSIDVQGSILAEGNEVERIIFTASDSHLFSCTEDLAGSWNGFKFINTKSSNQTSRFSFAVFEYAKAVDSSQPGVSDAGAVFQVYNFAKLKVENSIFTSNYAHYGAVFSLSKASDILIINNQFSNNKATIGGSVSFINYSNPRFINNTIINNEVLNPDDFYETGIIHSFISKPILYNNIMIQNIATYFEENQLFSAKAYHVRYNGLDFPFGYANTMLPDLSYSLAENDIYVLEPNNYTINSATTDLPYGIELPQFDIMGNPRLTNNSLDMGAVQMVEVSIDNQVSEVVDMFSLSPNPFTSEIRIHLSANNRKGGKVKIYNIKGQLVKTLSHGEISDNILIWNGKNEQEQAVSSGVYLFKYSSEASSQIRKAILIK